jgi:excisionase family DNA binding protein
MPEKDLFTRKETMEYLRISRGTLDKIMKRRKLPFIKFEKTRRGKVLFRKRDIEHFLESKTVRSKLNK